MDNMRSTFPVDDKGKTNSHSQIRRFDVKTFAFLDPHTGHPSVEEVSLPHSQIHTKVTHLLWQLLNYNISLRCTSTVGWKSAQKILTVHRIVPSYVSLLSSSARCVYCVCVCVRACSLSAFPFAVSEGNRQKRETLFESDKVQLVSLGPLLLGQNNTELEVNPCAEKSKSKYWAAQNYSPHVMNLI